MEFIEKYKDVTDGTWSDDVVSVSGELKKMILIDKYLKQFFKILFPGHHRYLWNSLLTVTGLTSI